MAEPIKCPFCGRIPTVEDCGTNRWFVRCKCGIAQDKLYHQRCDAVRAWNRRKPVTDVPSAVIETQMSLADCISRQAKQKYVSVMEKIERVHALKNALPCFEFDFSINPYLGFWYAEEGLYLIRDCMVDAYYFVEARSPHKAIEKVLKRVDEALHAGEPQHEEYE